MVAHSRATPPTRRGGPTATTGVEWIAQQARRAPQTRYTALMHHFTVDNLRACFAALDGTKAPGVDGVTKERYAQHLDIHLQALEDVSNLWICYPLGIRKNYQSEWGTR
jgi:RNA-directed DNA polymerase